MVTYLISQGPFQKQSSTRMISTPGPLKKGLFTGDWTKSREPAMDAEASRSRNGQKPLIMMLQPEGQEGK